MMTAWVTSGALLLVLLTGTSYSYPVKQDSQPPSSSNSDVKADFSASNWGLPSSGLAPAGAAPHPGAASRADPRSGAGFQGEPAASAYSSGHFPAHSSGAPAGSAYPGSSKKAYSPDTHWAVNVEGTQPRHGVEPLVSHPDSSYVSERLYPVPEFQAGELSKFEKVLEHGKSESETEEQGSHPRHQGFFPPQLPPPGLEALSEVSASEPQRFLPNRGWIWYPFPYDHMLLTGQYPPGTVSHFSSNFEQGNNHWHNTHYIRDNYHNGYVAPKPESVVYGPSGAGIKYPQDTGFGPQGSYSQVGAPEQRYRQRSTRGNDWRKVGH